MFAIELGSAGPPRKLGAFSAGGFVGCACRGPAKRGAFSAEGFVGWVHGATRGSAGRGGVQHQFSQIVRDAVRPRGRSAALPVPAGDQRRQRGGVLGGQRPRSPSRPRRGAPGYDTARAAAREGSDVQRRTGPARPA